MRIQITGRHVGVTEAMKEYAREKVEKLEKLHGRVTRAEVTMDAGHDRKVVEILLHVGGADLVAKAESPDMYAAVDLVEEKLARQLVRHKQKRTDHHHEVSMGTIPPGKRPPGEPAAPREETYEEIVEKLRDEDEPS